MLSEAEKGNKMKIGLIGNGFVGNAIYQNLKQKYEFVIYDTNRERANAIDIRQVCESAKIIFVALPTPMNQDGSCNTSIIEKCMREISNHGEDNLTILKSTIPPGTTRRIKKEFPNIRLVFSPEFLTEANCVEDFKNCNRMIFGGRKKDTAECVSIISEVFPEKHYFMTDWETAEMVKYFINNFLAVKTMFANEMKQICDSINVSYDSVRNLALYDERIGETHLHVPGPDGRRGFGGTCFPKDINAMISFAEDNGVEAKILKSVWEKNLEVREDKDWMRMPGRAITAKIYKKR